MLNRLHLPVPDSYSSEQECEDFLFKWRWPNGFSCPCCECESYYKISTRKLFECKECRMQISLTSGTVMHNSKLPLWVWFKAIDLLTSEPNHYSALSLADALGVNYRTARLMLNKIQFALQANSKEEVPASVSESEEICTDRNGNHVIKLKIIQLLHIKASRFIHRLESQSYWMTSGSRDQRLAKWMEAFTSSLYYRYHITW